jgi:hypothetical protein
MASCCAALRREDKGQPILPTRPKARVITPAFNGESGFILLCRSTNGSPSGQGSVDGLRVERPIGGPSRHPLHEQFSLFVAVHFAPLESELLDNPTG